MQFMYIYIYIYMFTQVYNINIIYSWLIDLPDASFRPASFTLISSGDIFLGGGPSRNFSLVSRASDNIAGKLDALPKGLL